ECNLAPRRRRISSPDRPGDRDRRWNRPLEGRVPAPAAQPAGHRRRRHHRPVPARGAPRADPGPLRRQRAARPHRNHPDHHPRARRDRRLPARARPLRRGPAEQADLGRPGVPADRCGVHRPGPGRRNAPRRPRRRLRRLGGQRHHALRRHPAVGAKPAARGQHRRHPRPEPVRDHDRHRRLADPDLRAAAPFLNALPARIRLHPGRADPRTEPGHDHHEPPAAQQHGSGDRAGNAHPGHRGDRRRRPVLPRPWRRTAAGRRVGPDAHLRPGRAEHRAAAGVPARRLHRHHRPRLHPAGGVPAGGPGSQDPAEV
ncbi:MAG: Dipeptide transport system permease protein DppC, partial [uncultured Arthrobacter sp.]